METEREEFKQYFPHRSDIIVNKNDKTISVTNYFDLNRIKVRVRAPYRAWVELEDTYLQQGFISFAVVENYLSRVPREAIAILRRYWAKEPQHISYHFYMYWIHEANARNPLFRPARKARGGNKHCRTSEEMIKIRITARHLYVVLMHWLKRPASEWPKEVHQYFKRHGLLDSHGDVLIDGLPVRLPSKQEYISSVVRGIIESYFDLKSEVEDRDFYNRYIVWRSLQPLKTFYDGVGFEVASEDLRKVFSS